MPRCSAGQVTGAAQEKPRASKHPVLQSLVSSAISPGALCTGETWQSALRAPCSAHIDSRRPGEKQGFTTAPWVHMLEGEEVAHGGNGTPWCPGADDLGKNARQSDMLWAHNFCPSVPDHASVSSSW